MAGVKGRSGGARIGAGRKPIKARKSKAKAYQTDDPDEFLRAVLRDSRASFAEKLTAAMALKGDVRRPGKREQRQAAAERVAWGDQPARPTPRRPTLVLVKPEPESSP
jgi:phage terminase small subunit